VRIDLDLFQMLTSGKAVDGNDLESQVRAIASLRLAPT
jgi:hypothetical protein